MRLFASIIALLCIAGFVRADGFDIANGWLGSANTAFAAATAYNLKASDDYLAGKKDYDDTVTAYNAAVTAGNVPMADQAWLQDQLDSAKAHLDNAINTWNGVTQFDLEAAFEYDSKAFNYLLAADYPNSVLASQASLTASSNTTQDCDYVENEILNASFNTGVIKTYLGN